jgi:Outer membrane protein beta-barrel domain
MSRITVVLLGVFFFWHGGLQAEDKSFVGILAGVSTLSADGASLIGENRTVVSLYSPENGPALNLLGGIHLNDFFSLQGSYVWNRNRLTLTSTLFSDVGQTLYQQSRNSLQHSVLGDLLLYFRNRDSRVRPYLSAGAGIVRFRSTQDELLAVRGSPELPPATFNSTKAALRVAVGVDLALARGWAFRYCFSESIRSNPVSTQLSPPGPRNLANFQNLFGVVKAF